MRRHRPRFYNTALLVSLAVACLAQQRKAAAIDYPPGLPFTWLFDTGAVSDEPFSADALVKKAAWTKVPENHLKHAFRGDAVIVNDKLAVLLRVKGRGAEVYAQAEGGWRSRAALAALPSGATALTSLISLRAVENSPAAVRVEATFATQGGAGRAGVSFRLTAGQNLVEMIPGEAADRLFVWCRPAYVVVPDFFADDMVFGPESIRPPRMGLPAENALLHLLRGGDGMIMCLWRGGGRQTAAIATARRQPRVIEGCEIAGAEGQSLWIGFFEGRGLWHDAPWAGDEETGELSLPWKPPFAARWRADLVAADGTAESWNLAATAGGPAADRNCPCRTENDRTVIRRPSFQGKPRTLVVYPLDRDRATPLAVYCPTDAIRNTLGVGPCQYILQTEGLATETNPTPDQVMTWVETQFERKRDKESIGEIRALLAAMVELVGRTQARIEQYAGFAGRAAPMVASDAALRETIHRLARVAAASPKAAEPRREARRLADEVAALAGKDGAAADCRRLGEELRRLGAEQDRTLSRCRMLVRWLQEQAAMRAEEGNDENAARLWAEAARLLERK